MFKKYIENLVCMFAVMVLVLPLLGGEIPGTNDPTKVPPPQPDRWIKQMPAGEYMFLSDGAKTFIDRIERGILAKGGKLGETAIATGRVPFKPVRVGIEDAFSNPDIRKSISRMTKAEIATVLDEVSAYLTCISKADCDEIQFARNKWAMELGVDKAKVALAK